MQAPQPNPMQKAYNENVNEKLNITLTLWQLNTLLNILSKVAYQEAITSITLLNPIFENFLNEKAKQIKPTIITENKPDIIS